MVLWEITLGTAYFLGLKRTYRLALKIQRRLITPNHPKIRKFVHRRTRSIFDMALKVHKNIQERDIEVGRNLGNWILRWLDRMKPSAQIRGEKPPSANNVNVNITKLSNNSQQKRHKGSQTFNARNGERESDRHLFTSSTNIWRKPFPGIAMMMRPAKPVGTNTQYRHFSNFALDAHKLDRVRFGYEGVIRKDIMQWMVRN